MRISDWSSDVCSSDLSFKNDLDDLQVAAGPIFRGRLFPGDQRIRPLAFGGAVAADDHKVRTLGRGPQVENRAVDRQDDIGMSFPVALLENELQLAKARSEEHTSELQSLMRTSYA